jgi:type IV pilus assembly protein PilB
MSPNFSALFAIMERKMNNKKLGQMLVSWGIISEERLNIALEVQQNRGGSVLVGEILVEMGYASDEDIVNAVATQYRLPYLPVKSYSVDEETIRLVPGSVAKKYLVIPLCRIGDKLTVAMSNPLNARAIREVEKTSCCSVHSTVTTRKDICQAIEKYYTN